MSIRTRKSTKKRRSHQATRRATRPSLWQSIQNANNRAHQRANNRSARRRGHKSIHATIAETAEPDYNLTLPQLTVRSLIGLLLLIPAAISTLALFTISDIFAPNSGIDVWKQLASSRPFLFFSVGAILMLGWFYARIFSPIFLYFYVLGHELTHAFFIYICGGQISGFKVTLQGGYVMTNKSNILIALSPYFVPFWSVVILGLSGIIRLFWDVPYHSEALYLTIGITWTFHLSWTLWMIPRDQPDLKENGTFFSLVLIYLANVLLLATLLCVAPQGLSFSAYAYHWINLLGEFITLVKTPILRFLYPV